MPVEKRLGALSSRTLGLAALVAISSAAQAAYLPLGPDRWNGPVQAHYDPSIRETRVSGQAAPKLCFSFSMPQEWRMTAQGAATRLGAAFSDAELEVSLRSAHELRHMPQPDLASRDAALLQRGYEDLLGRPAQSVSLASSASGATRWSATWVDANLPMASHAMTVETFIVPLSDEWVLELSLTNIEEREIYNALTQRLLTGLRVRSGTACQG